MQVDRIDTQLSLDGSLRRGDCGAVTGLHRGSRSPGTGGSCVSRWYVTEVVTCSWTGSREGKGRKAGKPCPCGFVH